MELVSYKRLACIFETIKEDKMNEFKLQNIHGRYITNAHLEEFLTILDPAIFKVGIIGNSVKKKPVYRIDFGTGNFKVLLWSQMHGNESTTTKAVLDVLNMILNDRKADWFEHFTFCFIPILNPDGAEAYTRVNANGVDLNRDSCELSQPESKILRSTFDEFKPDLALNMHDQRTIFSAGPEEYPATISFLAPSYNEECTVNDTRFFAMQLIARMNEVLKERIPRQIGRFDDAFNINCIGDMFTYLNVPTILFEAGHFQNDYHREVTRDIVREALTVLLDSIIEGTYGKFTLEDYLSIPENEKNFVDIIVENHVTTNEELKKHNKLPVLFKELLTNGQIQFVPVLDFNSAPHYKYGHIVLNFNGLEINNEKDIQNLIKELS